MTRLVALDVFQTLLLILGELSFRHRDGVRQGRQARKFEARAASYDKHYRAVVVVSAQGG